MVLGSNNNNHHIFTQSLIKLRVKDVHYKGFLLMPVTKVVAFNRLLLLKIFITYKIKYTYAGGKLEQTHWFLK